MIDGDVTLTATDSDVTLAATDNDVARAVSVAEATENSRRMNYGVERAVVLTQRLDAMIDDVIDDCYFCSRVRNMVSSSESQH